MVAIVGMIIVTVAVLGGYLMEHGNLFVLFQPAEILIIFGAGKLPEIGGAIGKGIKNFKKASREPEEIDVTPDAKKIDEKKPSANP